MGDKFVLSNERPPYLEKWVQIYSKYDLVKLISSTFMFIRNVMDKKAIEIWDERLSIRNALVPCIGVCPVVVEYYLLRGAYILSWFLSPFFSHVERKKWISTHSVFSCFLYGGLFISHSEIFGLFFRYVSYLLTHSFSVVRFAAWW